MDNSFLFDSPILARPLAANELAPSAGGIGTGFAATDAAGSFTRWRLDPTLPATDHAVPRDRFYVWTRERSRHGVCVALTGGAPAAPLARRSLFPFMWTDYAGRLAGICAGSLRLESAGFSPLLPNESGERSLPLHMVVFRARNGGSEPIEAALMLTWACGWPDAVEAAEFDFQHDNLCLTGSLGAPDSSNRQGIAVPDLHYAGIYRQGVEPWQVGRDDNALVEDFADDGELDPWVARGTPHGAAAWIKFELQPGETKEAPFVVAWHFPFYASGPEAGEPRYYTQFLGRRRPDNAIVWLAEQAFQHFGAETANYRYWMQQIGEWQAGAAPDVVERRAEAMRLLVDPGIMWTDCGRVRIAATGVQARAVRDAGAALRDIWPDVADAIEATNE